MDEARKHGMVTLQIGLMAGGLFAFAGSESIAINTLFRLRHHYANAVPLVDQRPCPFPGKHSHPLKSYGF
jgi:hypothetical protein